MLRGDLFRPLIKYKNKIPFLFMPEIHPIILIIDYILVMVMWTLIAKVAMNIFQRENSEFFFMKVFVKLTNPFIRLFKPITPSFIIPFLVPLYVAWFFYMFRFYFMPYLLDRKSVV